MREAKLIITSEDKSRKGIDSAKQGMGSLIETAKESKRTLEGINAVLQLGGWTIMAAKAVKALKDITKEARENSDAFKEATGAFANAKRVLGDSIVTTMSPLVSWVAKVAQGWADATEKLKKHNEALKTTSELRTLEQQKDIVTYDLGEQRKILASQIKMAFPTPDALARGAGNGAYQKFLDVNPAQKEILKLQGQLNELNKAIAAVVVPAATGESPTPAEIIDTAVKAAITTMHLESQLALAGEMTPAAYGPTMPAVIAEARWGIEDEQRAEQRRGTGGLSHAIDTKTGIPAQGLMEAFGPLVGMFKQLGSLQQILSPLNTIFKGMLDVLGPLIDAALKPLLDLLLIVGNTIGELLAPVIRFLGDIIAAVAKALLAVVNWIRGILGLAKVSSPASSYTTTGGSGGGGASYAGAQAITFNFYNQGNVVGSGGMQELATLIHDLIRQQERYA